MTHTKIFPRSFNGDGTISSDFLNAVRSHYQTVGCHGMNSREDCPVQDREMALIFLAAESVLNGVVND